VRKVFKYPIVLNDYIEVELPKDSQMLHIGFQRGGLQLWALVDSNAEHCIKKIRCAGTGHLIVEENLRFIETVHMMDDNLIFHFFEVIEN
jgi:hypothetical protein